MSKNSLIDEEISKLLDNGVLVLAEPSVDQFISKVYVREKKEGSFRMILNFSDFNESVVYKKFKRETGNFILLSN